MSATEAQIARLRRMINEPDAEGTYDDDALTVYIEQYPLVDAAGLEPDDDDWTATYDLFAAAADLLYEKAATVAEHTDYSADGGSFSLSQKQRGLLTQAEKYTAESKGQLRNLPC